MSEEEVKVKQRIDTRQDRRQHLRDAAGSRIRDAVETEHILRETNIKAPREKVKEGRRSWGKAHDAMSSSKGNKRPLAQLHYV